MYRYGQEEIDAVERVIRSGQWFRYGENPQHRHESQNLEKELAAYVNVPHCCYLTNGTAALMCAYAGLGLGPGDEVIMPGFTWVASALAPMSVGVIPILAEVDETLMLSPKAVEAAITPRTRAINVIHMAGLSCDMKGLVEVAKKHNLYIIEDACQCDGGVWTDGRKLGSIGDFGAYSFNAFKVISSGEGGAFFAHREDWFERAIIFHDCGANFFGRTNKMAMFGGHLFRGNEIMAAMTRVQLQRLDGIVADLQRNRAAIEAIIGNEPYLCPMPRNGGPSTGTGGTMGFRFSDRATATSFAKALTALGTEWQLPKCGGWLPIDSGRHVYCNWEALMEHRGSYHPALDPLKHPANAQSRTNYTPDALPKTLHYASTTVLVGINPDWTPAQVQRVAEAMKQAGKANPGLAR